MGRGIAIFFEDVIAVETYLGQDGRGRDKFSAPQTVKGFSEDNRRMVNDTQGGEVISDITVYTYLTHAALFKPNSRVVINGDTTSPVRVISAKANNGPSALRLPDHLAVTLGFSGA